MKARQVDDDGLPEDLRTWPTDEAELQAFYERRMAWAKAHGEAKMPILIELRRRRWEMRAAAARDGAA